MHRLIPDTGPSPGFVHMGEEDYDQLTDEILREGHWHVTFVPQADFDKIGSDGVNFG